MNIVSLGEDAAGEFDMSDWGSDAAISNLDVGDAIFQTFKVSQTLKVFGRREQKRLEGAYLKLLAAMFTGWLSLDKARRLAALYFLVILLRR